MVMVEPILCKLSREVSGREAVESDSRLKLTGILLLNTSEERDSQRVRRGSGELQQRKHMGSFGRIKGMLICEEYLKRVHGTGIGWTFSFRERANPSYNKM